MSFFLWKNTQNIERIEPFLDISQGIVLFCWKYDSKNWTFFFGSIWLKELFLLFFMIQILGPFSHDSKNWTFFFTWLKYLNLFEKFWFKEMDPFFSGLKVFSSRKNSQNWIFLNPTHRIEFFCELNRLISCMTQRFEPFFSKYHSKNWFFWKESKNWTLFEKMTQRIELFLEVCLKEFNSFSDSTQRIEFFKHDSKNWTSLSNTTQNFEPFFFGVNTTQRIELFCEHDWKAFEKKLWLKESKLFFYDSRIVFFFFKKATQNTDFFKIWLTELQLFFSEIMTQRIEFLECDSKNWTFWKYDSQNGTFFWIWLIELHFLKKRPWLKEMNFFYITQRIEPLKNKVMIQRIELCCVSL